MRRSELESVSGGWFGVRTLLVFAILTGIVISFYSLRLVTAWRWERVLAQPGVWIGEMEPDQLPWFERWCLVPRVPRATSVQLRPPVDVVQVSKVLAEMGTVRELEYYELSSEQLKSLVSISSLSVIKTRSHVSESDIEALAGLRLTEFWAYGSDNDLSAKVLERLYRMPSIQRIGTADGQWAVPDKLRRERPEVEVEMTDFPA